MKKVTVSLDERVYRRAKATAAMRGISLSALVGGYLEGLNSRAEVERLREAERELRKRVGNFAGSDRLARNQLHERSECH
jgi:hypothetical protein